MSGSSCATTALVGLTRSGTGLLNLADRVHALGGTFDLTSPRGGGTCLVVVLPVGDVAG